MLSVIVNGETTSLDDGTLCYYIDDDGLGMTPLHRITGRGPLQHGDTDIDYRLDPRVFRLVLEIEGSSGSDLYDKRSTMLRLFKPRLVAPILEWVLPNGDTRRLTAHYISDMNLPNSDRQSFSQKVVVTMKANDPTYYDPAGDNYVFSIGGGADTMEVPTVIPMTIGASTIDANAIVINAGTVATYPIIRITGPIHDAVITNNTTGDKLDFTGDTIDADHYYDIDLRYGYKTVIDNHAVNQISKLTSDSDLVSFNLAADPDAVDGYNSITVTGSTATVATGVSFVWFNRYIGI